VARLQRLDKWECFPVPNTLAYYAKAKKSKKCCVSNLGPAGNKILES